MKHVRTLTLLILMITGTAATSAFAEGPLFPDMDPRYELEAVFMQEHAMIKGFPDGHFHPERLIRRADAAVMLGRALGFDETPTHSGFTDIPDGHYASGHIAQAVEAGIVFGTGQDRFSPDAYLTRGQMSLLIKRAFPDLPGVHESAFFDVTPDHTLYDSVMHLSKSGVANGFNDGTFRPGDEVNRIQMTLFLARAMNEDFRVSPVPLPEQPRIASTKTAGESDQILTVVHDGNGRATVTYWKKDPYVWTKVRTTTNGFVGINGVSETKREGDRNAPVGSFRMPFAFGTANPGTKMPFRPITNRSYWISNVNDPQYNTWQERSRSHAHDEHLIRYRDQYKYAMAIDYNMANPVPGKGSAIFLHVSNGTPTLGCVSVPESTMRYFMQELGPNTGIIIVENEADIYNY